MSTICPVSFGDPATQAQPFDAYDQIRADGAVYLDPATGYYVLLDPEMLRRVATDTKRFSSNTGQFLIESGPLGIQMDKVRRELGIHLAPVLLITDPPEHSFHRSLVDKTMTSTRVKALEAFLVEVVDEMVDEFADHGKVEFVSEMAVLVPANIVAALVGVPRNRVADIKRWSDAASGGSDPTLSDERKLEAAKLTCELQRFLLDTVIHYRHSPNESLLSELANADVAGRKLSDAEIVPLAQQLIIAGHETTASVMASAMHRMICTPGLENLLRDTPEQIPAFIEEVLRLDSPLQGIFRKTTEDLELGGVAICAGSIVVLRWGAANRDPKTFAEPAALDLGRSNSKRHLAFGFGPHFCVGNQLARAELRIAFERLLARLQGFRLVREPQRLEHYFLYGITRLEIAFERRNIDIKPA